jgi:hypothetical protein
MSNFDYIVNPKTGRKVNINGKIGKKILTNYISTSQTGGEDGGEQVHQPLKTPKYNKAMAVVAKMQHKAAEFERKSPKAAKLLKAAGKGGVKTVLGLVPGGKSIASGLFNVGKIASEQAFKRNRSVRDNWWKNHKESGTWQRNKNKAELQYSILDHDNNGFITREEYINSVPGMHHPDTHHTVMLKEKEKIRADLIQGSKYDIHSAGKMPTNEEIAEIIAKQNKKSVKKVKSAVKKIAAMKKIQSSKQNNSFANIALANSAKSANIPIMPAKKNPSFASIAKAAAKKQEGGKYRKR